MIDCSRDITPFLRTCATSTEASTVELETFARSLRVTLPFVDKWHSDCAEGAGITRICLAISTEVSGFLASCFCNK